MANGKYIDVSNIFVFVEVRWKCTIYLNVN